MRKTGVECLYDQMNPVISHSLSPPPQTYIPSSFQKSIAYDIIYKSIWRQYTNTTHTHLSISPRFNRKFIWPKSGSHTHAMLMEENHLCSSVTGNYKAVEKDGHVIVLPLFRTH